MEVRQILHKKILGIIHINQYQSSALRKLLVINYQINFGRFSVSSDEQSQQPTGTGTTTTTSSGGANNSTTPGNLLL